MCIRDSFKTFKYYGEDVGFSDGQLWEKQVLAEVSDTLTYLMEASHHYGSELFLLLLGFLFSSWLVKLEHYLGYNDGLLETHVSVHIFHFFCHHSSMAEMLWLSCKNHVRSIQYNMFMIWYIHGIFCLILLVHVYSSSCCVLTLSELTC